ncbi:MAG: hypothetical protein PVG39_15560 [Desulfobacteraceae bacterium]|jgi:hypothetical protein
MGQALEARVQEQVEEWEVLEAEAVVKVVDRVLEAIAFASIVERKQSMSPGNPAMKKSVQSADLQ